MRHNPAINHLRQTSGEPNLPLQHLPDIAAGLPAAWSSTQLGMVGNARIKVLRMDEQAYREESHPHTEALLVLEGCMLLSLAGREIEVKAGELCMVEAGTPHAVLPGSAGTLVIVDVAA
jgi:mannose-6-phosphate isomerase-like protein (cupin superfamily)